MAIKFNRSQTFATGGTVTSAALHSLVDGTDIYPALITDQSNLATISTADKLLIADTDDTINAKSTTVQNLFDQAFSGGTYTALNLSGALTFGTATGNRTVSTSATITTGTIPNLTAGTTTSTAANITNGTIQTLTSSTATITGGTFSGSVNSTAGTIGNLSTTLAGDLTISQGTATLGTSGVTASSYGTTSEIPRITVDAKGRITSATTVTAPVGFRNRIINGDMRIDQRNAGASVTLGAVNGTYTLDRYSWYTSQASKLSTQRSTVAPSGFSNSMLITSLSAYSITSTDYFWFRQGIEGFNVSDLAWGTASAGSVTLSFWVRSSLTGTFGGSLYNETAGYSCPFSYSISAADTWERKTVSISGATTGTWKTNQDCGVFVQWTLGAGSTRTGGTSGTWQASATDGPNGITSLVGTNGATFYITGVQLEAGSTATEFERRPYGTELALCQRYYYQTSDNLIYLVVGPAGAQRWAQFNTPHELRANPTVVIYGNANKTNSGQFQRDDNTFQNISAANAGRNNVSTYLNATGCIS